MKDILIKNLHVFILIYAGFGLFAIWEEKSVELENAAGQVPAVASKIQRAKVKLARIKKFKKNLVSSEKRVQEVVKKIEKVQRQLPSEINDTEVQGLLSDISNKLKILEPSPSPGNEEKKGFYFAKSYNFEAKGTFLQFLIFYELLGNEDRILNVSELSMKVSDSNDMRSRFQILDFETGIESYRYNTAYRVKEETENEKDKTAKK